MRARRAVVRTRLRGGARPYARLMGMRELADLLGYEGADRLRTLRRQLRTIEAATGRPFLVRTGPGVRARYLVTLAVLREVCPQFFDRREVALESVRTYIEQIEARFSELDLKIEALARKLMDLRAEERRRPAAPRGGL